jgi:hypothetical protein
VLALLQRNREKESNAHTNKKGGYCGKSYLSVPLTCINLSENHVEESGNSREIEGEYGERCIKKAMSEQTVVGRSYLIYV